MNLSFLKHIYVFNIYYKVIYIFVSRQHFFMFENAPFSPTLLSKNISKIIKLPSELDT